MRDRFTEQYWEEEFQVTEADLDRITGHIRDTKTAYDLTTLARRVVRGRLRHGPETSAPAQRDWVKDLSVRLWNPARDVEWETGDQTYIWTWSFKHKRDEVKIGEIVEIDHEYAYILVEDVSRNLRKLERADPGSTDAKRWHRRVQEAIEALEEGTSEEDQVERVVLKHGQRTMSQLLDTLRADQRFVRLAGRWFLRDLAVPVTDDQLTTLAWAMVALEESAATDELVPLVDPPLAEGDPGLFGLYLAMRERPELFQNADRGKRPRWVLAGAPSGTHPSRHAAYDPETYEILCLPGEDMPPEAIHRLWELELLGAVTAAD